MKKSLIALAVAATLVAPVAMADTSNVTVYGTAHMSIDRVKDGVTPTSSNTNQLSSRESNIGFKGSEDLSNGLSAVFQVESEISFDGASPFGR